MQKQWTKEELMNLPQDVYDRLEIMFPGKPKTGDMQKQLEKGIFLSSKYHLGQVDKIGDPYIFHPMRVMNALDTLLEKTVGIMHDLVEDTKMTLALLKEEDFDLVVITCVDNVTRRPDESYGDFLNRVASNPVSIKVKKRDIEDNLLPWRQIKWGESEEKTIARVKKYRKSWLFLDEKLKVYK